MIEYPIKENLNLFHKNMDNIKIQYKDCIPLEKKDKLDLIIEREAEKAIKENPTILSLYTNGILSNTNLI